MLFYLHRGNLEERDDRVDNPKYSQDMTQLALGIFNLAKTFITYRKKPSTPPIQGMHWTEFDKPVDQMNSVERIAVVERLPRVAFVNLTKREK